MPDYKEMYFALFREVTKTIEQLQKAQQIAEQMYMESDEKLVVFMDPAEDDKIHKE